MRNPGLVKRGPRFDVEFGCTLVDSGGEEYAVRVENISKAGCKIVGERMPRIGETVVLRLGSQGDQAAKIRWSFDGSAGAAFDKELDLAD